MMRKGVNVEFLHMTLVVSLVTVMGWSVIGAPLSSSDLINIQVQPELLLGRRLVLSLEPLPVGTRDAKALPHNPDSTTTTTINQDTTTTMSPTTTTTITTITDASSSTTAQPASTTMVPDAITEASDDDAPVTAIISKSPSLPGTRDVDHFLITIPKLRCSSGYFPDPSGKCRLVFRTAGPFSRARSISDALSSRAQHHFSFQNVSASLPDSSPPSLPFVSLMRVQGKDSVFRVSQEVDINNLPRHN